MADKVKVAGFNGTPAVMANVQKGTAVKMDVGNPNMWFSAGAADAIFSTLAGKKPIEDAGVPFRVFTQRQHQGPRHLQGRCHQLVRHRPEDRVPQALGPRGLIDVRSRHGRAGRR